MQPFCLHRFPFARTVFTILVSMASLVPSLFAQSKTAPGSLVDFDEEEQESGEEIIAREQFFYARHAGGPGKTIPKDAYAKAVEEKRLLDQTLRNTPSSPPANWISVNPAGMFYARTGNNYISGRTNSIAFHPTNASIIYIGAAGGGVWKTTNAGITWQVLTDSLTAVTCGAVAVDPTNPNVVYYGTGEMNFSLDSYYGDGLYKSTDGGTTWAHIATTAVGQYISQIAINPLNSNILYLSGSNGVYKSTNAGASWTGTSSGANANCVLLNPSNPQILYTSTGGSGGNTTRKSTDGGATWSVSGTGLPSSPTAGRTQLAMAPSNPNVLYASVTNSGTSGVLGLYRSTDGGSNWTLQSSSPNYLGGQGWYDNAVCVHPTNPDIVVVGGLDIYASTNGGVTLVQRTAWATTSSSNMSHADIHWLGYNNGMLYCGSDGGVYQSTNDGVAWSDLNATISTLQFQGADYDPTDPSRLYGGTQDNNLETSTDNGANWIQRTTGDGGYSVVDPVTPNYVYGQYVNGSLKRSNNYGVSFTDIEPNGSSGGLFYNPYEMAPTDHNTIVYAQADVWKTTSVQTATSSSGWTLIATSGVVGGSAASIAVSNNPNKIYVGTSNGRILVTANNGGSWSSLSGFPYVSDLFVDDVNDDVCYAGCTGFSAGSHVYKTTNGGGAWTNITGNLPNIPVNTIVVRTASPRMIFVGTDIGVFQSTNEGTSWVPFNNGFPAVAVFDLKYHDIPNILLAATHGRGCFKYTQLPPLPGVRLTLSASNIDFGNVEAGISSDTVTVTIENRGSDTLIVSSISNTLGAFQLTGLPSLPARIPGLGSTGFNVLCRPSAHGVLNDTIRIVTNDPSNSTAKVSLHSKGILIGRAQAGVMYAVSTGGSSPSQLFTINTTTGLATAVGQTGLADVTGLAIRPSNKELYATFATASNTAMYRLSQPYGDALLNRMLAVPNMRAIAFSLTGDTLYGGTTTGRLYRINIATGDTTYIGTATGKIYSGFATNPASNQLWASVRPPLTGRDSIYVVNRTIGSATAVGRTGLGIITPYIAFNKQGNLYALIGSGSQTNTLYALDTLTAAGTLIGSTGVIGLQVIAMRTDSSGIVAVDEKTVTGIPGAFELEQNYPNPFNPTTHIRYGLPMESRITITIYNLMGQEVARLLDGVQSAGYHNVSWNNLNSMGLPVASGIYLFKLEASGGGKVFTELKKMVLLK